MINQSIARQSCSCNVLKAGDVKCYYQPKSLYMTQHPTGLSAEAFPQALPTYRHDFMKHTHIWQQFLTEGRRRNCYARTFSIELPSEVLDPCHTETQPSQAYISVARPRSSEAHVAAVASPLPSPHPPFLKRKVTSTTKILAYNHELPHDLTCKLFT